MQRCIFLQVGAVHALMRPCASFRDVALRRAHTALSPSLGAVPSREGSERHVSGGGWWVERLVSGCVGCWVAERHVGLRCEGRCAGLARGEGLLEFLGRFLEVWFLSASVVLYNFTGKLMEMNIRIHE